ncbi:MAG: aldo/keto reductase, partial [Gammaproteobacteria bacterium]|nr:aldo/keto reductase [Gammaproteobacteria bacterium]
ANTDAAIKEYVKLAKAYDLDACQMALAFVNDRPFVSSTLIGATNMTQLKNNIAAIDIELSDEIYAKIKQIRRNYPMPF